MPASPSVAESSTGTDGEWSIELLRGLAALLVVTAHYLPPVVHDAGLLRFAFTGVDLFFVISGFVFAPYLFGKGMVIRAYLVRRLFRIYPLYLLALFAYAGLRWASGQNIDHLGQHLLLLHTLQTREIAFQFNPAFWSLPPEVEFYLALPLLAPLAGTLRRVLAIGLAALAVHALVAWHSPSDVSGGGIAWVLGFHLPALLAEFMLGTLAWWIVQRKPGVALRALMLALGLLGWWWLAGRFLALGDAGMARSDWWRGNIGLVAALAYALIVAAWVGWVPRPGVWLSVLATVAGNLSYGLYLFHNAMPSALAALKPAVGAAWFAVICLVATAALAQVLHWIWEAPWRSHGRAVARRIELAHARGPTLTDR